jgi:hypothetical protein
MGKVGKYTYSLAICNICITAVWHILRPFGILVAIWYIFPTLGLLCYEKSGNMNVHNSITAISQEAMQNYDTPRSIKDTLDRGDAQPVDPMVQPVAVSGQPVNPFGNYDVPHPGSQPIPVFKKSCGCIMKLGPTIKQKGFFLKKRLPGGGGANPGPLGSFYFIIFTTLPLSHSGSPQAEKNAEATSPLGVNFDPQGRSCPLG